MSETKSLLPCAERVVVAVRTSGPHRHVERVQFEDGSEEAASDAIAAIKGHQGHYVMRVSWHKLPLLLRVQQCPDCNEEVLWA